MRTVPPLLLLALAACGSRVDFPSDSPSDSPAEDTDSPAHTDEEPIDTGWDTADPVVEGSWSTATSGTFELAGGPPLVGLWDVASSGDTVLAVSGGRAWISSDAGATWTASGPPEWTYYARSAAITGDGMFVAGSTNGTWRSTDGGATWARAEDGLAGEYVQSLLADGDALYALGYDTAFRWESGAWVQITLPAWPAMPNVARGDTLYSAYELGGGLWVSTDRGDTWAQRSTETIGTLFPEASAGETLVASESGRLRISEDGGATWTTKGTLPDQPSRIVVKDGTWVMLTAYGGLFASTDGGATWKDANTGISEADRLFGLDLAVTASGDLLFGTSAHGAYRSADGLTWTASSDGLTGGFPRDFAKHGDQLLVAFGGPDLWAWDVASDSWSVFATPGHELTAVLAVESNGSAIVLNTAYEGLVRSADGGKTWKPANEGLPTFIGDIGEMPMPVSDVEFRGATAFAALTNGPEQASQGTEVNLTGGGVARSDDGGATWTWIREGIDEAGRQWDGMAYWAPLSATESWSDLVLAGSASWGVYRSLDKGWTWERGSGFPFSTVVTDLARVGDTLYASGEGQPGAPTSYGVWRSDDLGVSWTRISDGLPEEGRVLDVEAADGVVFALVGGDGQGVYRLDGSAWTPFAAPEAGVQLVPPLLVEADAMVVGAYDRGLFRVLPIE